MMSSISKSCVDSRDSVYMWQCTTAFIHINKGNCCSGALCRSTQDVFRHSSEVCVVCFGSAQNIQPLKLCVCTTQENKPEPDKLVCIRCSVRWERDGRLCVPVFTKNSRLITGSASQLKPLSGWKAFNVKERIKHHSNIDEREKKNHRSSVGCRSTASWK